MFSGCIFNRTNHVKTGCHISYYNFRTVQYLGMKLKTQRELEVLVNVCKVQLCSITASTIFRRGGRYPPPIIPYQVKPIILTIMVNVEFLDSKRVKNRLFACNTIFIRVKPLFLSWVEMTPHGLYAYVKTRGYPRVNPVWYDGGRYRPPYGKS